MFGFFKKQISATEFGLGTMQFSHEFLAADAGRALGMRFDNFDGSNGWANFLERRGVTKPVQRLHFRLYAHCAMQAASLQFDKSIARELVSGAMSGFPKSVEGYDFEHTYQALHAAYGGQHSFQPHVEALSNTEAQLDFLPNANAGVVNAKFLLESFVHSNLNNYTAFIDSFKSYSSTACASVGTVCRAIDQLSSSYKLS